MPAPDKSPARPTSDRPLSFLGQRQLPFSTIGGALLLAVVLLSSCNRMVTPPGRQVLKDADAKVSSGDFLEAITLYESALDGSARSADIHYRLALLYDDKMNDPLHALHHFKRYLTLAPTDAKVSEVKNFMKRDEIKLVTSLSEDSLVTRAEAARLRNDNLRLQKELEDRTAQARNAGATEKSGRGSRAEKSPSPAKHNKAAARSHVVQSGDTLFSLSRQYYNSPDRWKDIRDANGKSIEGPGKLKVGQTLIIP
ncbi:MAG: LysM peptidoglycan-binding domain-containing protein [Chthoniobacterales bacterium]